MTHVFINEFKLRQRKLPLPNFLELEKVKKHRSRAIESSREIEEILNQGHEIIGIDCEMFEFDQSKTTEIGIGRISKSGIRVEHIIISDYYNLRNSKRVPDNKNNFIYGSSTQMTLHDAELYVGDVFGRAKYVYGHALKGDLEQVGAKVPGQLRFDTSTLHMKLIVAKEGIHKSRRARLSRLCEIYTPELNDTPYHNAGNDIYVTGAILKTLANVKYISEFLGELNDSEIIARTKKDDIERILSTIPRLNHDLDKLINESGIKVADLLEDKSVIESILTVHQNIYRRMLKYGNKEFWLDKVELGLVGELFTQAIPVPERVI